MPYDPNFPASHLELTSPAFRGQFNGLFEFMQAVAAGCVTGAQIAAVNTIDPRQPAGVSVQIIGGVMHFTFNIPRGATGAAGTDGAPGGPGPAGPQGPPFANALIGNVTTLNPGENAWVTMMFDGTNVTFFFGIPRGIDGASGVTPQVLDTAILGTSRNSNNVSQLTQGADSDYNPIQIQAMLNKIDELINALRR